MPSILTSALALLSISSLAVVNAGNSKFYLEEEKCNGGTYVDFDITEVHKCYSLTSGAAASFYTEKGNELDYVQTYRKDKSLPCGKTECSVKKANSCCSSKKKQITGVQMVRFMEPCSPLPHCRRMQPEPVNPNCTSVEEIGEPFIPLDDGTHFSLGKGNLGKLSAEDLQTQLEVNGKQRLPISRLIKLDEAKVIRYYI